MNKEFNQFKKRIKSLITSLPQETDTSWLVSTYLSLKKAHRLRYQHDAISKLNRSDQDKILLNISSFDFKTLNKLSKDEKIWLAGYFFNNAMFRMVALTEIGLKVLFEKKMNLKAPDDYWWLSKWYESTYSKNLNNIQKARSRVNKFKHKPRVNKSGKQFEIMSEGINAFDELLSLMEQL